VETYLKGDARGDTRKKNHSAKTKTGDESELYVTRGGKRGTKGKLRSKQVEFFSRELLPKGRKKKQKKGGTQALLDTKRCC